MQKRIAIKDLEIGRNSFNYTYVLMVHALTLCYMVLSDTHIALVIYEWRD